MSRVARIKVVDRQRLRYGSGAPGKLIPPEETGGLGILVPSFGAMEQDEVDYTALAASELEKERVKAKRGKKTEMQERVQTLVDLAYSKPEGQRGKAITEAMQQKQRMV